MLLRNKCNGKLSLWEADQEQYKFTDELKKSRKIECLGKMVFLKNAGLLLKGRAEVFNAFRGDMFLMKDIDDEEDYEDYKKN